MGSQYPFVAENLSIIYGDCTDIYVSKVTVIVMFMSVKLLKPSVSMYQQIPHRVGESS
jgi:hypothetical protein